MITQNIADKVRLSKIKLARKTAYTNSKKNKVLKDAQSFDSEIDEKIKSVALNKFVIRKQQKLQELGKTKAEIDSIILDIKSAEDNIISKKIGQLKGFGIDQKFIGLTSDEILKKINSNTSQKKSENKTEKSNESETQKSQKSEKIENKKTPTFQKKEKALKLNVDEETDTISDIDANNEKIYDYLVKSGELDVANYVLDLMTKPENEIKKTSEMKKDLKSNTEEVKKLSLINSGIYEELKTIQENQIDEQDTSVSIPDKLANQSQDISFDDSPEKAEEKKSGFWGFLKALGLAKMIRYFSGLFSNKKFLSAIEFIKKGDFKGFLKHLGGTKGLSLMLKTVTMGLLSKALAPIKGAIKLINIALLPLIALKATVSNLIKMLPNIPVVGKYFKSIKSVDGSNLKKTDVTKPNKVDSYDLDEKTEKKVSENNSKTKEINEKKKPKTKKLSRSKVGGKTAKKVASKTGGKLATKLLKFAKFVPFLGTALTAGTAIYAAHDGYKNADKILNTPKENLKPIHKLAAAAGSAIEDLLWPVSPEASTTAGLVLKAAGSMGMDISPKELADEKSNKSAKSSKMSVPFKVDNDQNIQVSIPKANDNSKYTGLSSNVLEIEKQLKEIQQQQQELVKKYGQRSGNRMYNNLYSQKIIELTKQLEIEKMKKPDVDKNKKIQNIENTQKQLANSTVSFEAKKSQSMTNEIAKAININNINQETKKEAPSVLNAFESV